MNQNILEQNNTTMKPMEKIKHTLLLLLLIPCMSYSQRVYVTDNRQDADLLVYKVKYFCEAHLAIKKTYDWSLPKKFHWFFVNSQQAADPGWIIYYVDKRHEADTCVYFTDRMGLLGSYCPVKTPVEVDVDKKRGNGY